VTTGRLTHGDWQTTCVAIYERYFLHLSRRLGYPSDAECYSLAEEVKAVFACLHGLIKAVEKESGRLVNLAESADPDSRMKLSGNQVD